MSEHLYIYGITRAGEAPAINAPAVFEADNPILTMTFGDFEVIASRISVLAVDATRRNMMAHTRILERSMEHATVLPVRFGMIVDNQAILQARVASHATRLTNALKDIEGRIEVGIRFAFGDGVVVREVGEERHDLRRKGDALAKRNANETYYERIDLGREVEAAMAAKRKNEGLRITALVQPFSVRLEKLGISDDNGILNLALLVEKDKAEALAAAVDAIDAEKPGRFLIRYTAPVPPYNFVRILLDDEKKKAA
jgi:Gas vesicle synthesis protein GvpL/GvpF